MSLLETLGRFREPSLPQPPLMDLRSSKVIGMAWNLRSACRNRWSASLECAAASALGVKEVLARLEHFVRHSVEARPQVEAEVLATTRTDHVDVPETDPVDHTQPVVFGLGEDGVDRQLQPLGEVFEPRLGRGLQDYRILCQEDAPGFVLVPAVPALPFRQLDRGAAAGGEGDLVDLSGSLDREAASAEGLVVWGDVLVQLGDGAEAELADDEDEGVGGEWLVAALSLHCCSLGLQGTLRWGCLGKVNWLPLGARLGVRGARLGWV